MATAFAQRPRASLGDGEQRVTVAVPHASAGVVRASRLVTPTQARKVHSRMQLKLGWASIMSRLLKVWQMSHESHAEQAFSRSMIFWSVARRCLSA